MVSAQTEGMVQAEYDLDIRKGYEMDDRPFISYAEVEELQATGRGQQLRRYGVVMRTPDRFGNPGKGMVVTMPAEKFQKWYGQGYRPTVSVSDHQLHEFGTPPSPIRWLPSMVEEAIANGEAVPEDMAPAGYYGPTIPAPRSRRSRGAGASEE